MFTKKIIHDHRIKNGFGNRWMREQNAKTELNSSIKNIKMLVQKVPLTFKLIVYFIKLQPLDVYRVILFMVLQRALLSELLFISNEIRYLSRQKAQNNENWKEITNSIF